MNNLFKKSKSSQGLTLLETLVAIGIVTIGVVSAINLVSFGLGRAKLNSQELIAINLAQEGIEIIRNQRDTNWLIYPDQKSKWNKGIDGNSSGKNYIVDITGLINANPSSYRLKLDPVTGFYNHTTGADTDFSRQIVIVQQPATQQENMTVRSIVNIEGIGTPITLQEDLYNWW